MTAAIIQAAFEPHEIAVFEGGIDVAEALLEKPIDHVFFTGSPTVGKIVMAAAAKHLASVTLELGGKCPAIVDGTTDLREVAEIVSEGRQYNSGQICLAIDHVWIKSDLRDAFVEEYWDAVDRKFYTDGRFDQDKISRIVNDKNTARVQSYVDDAVARGAKLTTRGLGNDDEFEPAVLLDVPLDSKVMQEEIFGPVLPILTFDDLSEVFDYTRNTHKPLALYLFSSDEDNISEVLSQTSSGGVTVNGWASQWGDSALPFGGVNHSGIGSYHGYFGFKELSHERAVIVHTAGGGTAEAASWDERLIVPPKPQVASSQGANR